MCSVKVFALSAVRKAMLAEAALFRFRETGGVLFGYRVDDEIVVTNATEPGPRAKHGFCSFRPDSRYCQKQLIDIYGRSSGVITYLGDWHTHPHGGTRPSQTDTQSMIDMASDAEVRQPEPILWLFRPADELFSLKWNEEHSVFLLDGQVHVWRPAPIYWIDELPD